MTCENHTNRFVLAKRIAKDVILRYRRKYLIDGHLVC